MRRSTPLYTQVTVPARAFGVRPPEELQTAALSWRLVARKDVGRATVAALLQTLFVNRLDLARVSVLAWSIKGVPDDDATSAKLPNHRGALDYYNREQQTFMDLYGDWLWLGLFAAGGLQTFARRRKQLV